MKEVTRAIIQDSDGKILLAKRARGIAAGEWHLPGGKPDIDETLLEAIKREIREELDVDFDPYLYLAEIDDKTNPQDPWKVYFFTGEISGVLQPNDEISAIMFVSPEELINLTIAFNHKERLEEFFRTRI